MLKKIRTIAILLLLFLFVFAFLPQIVHFITNIAWFNEVGYEDVFLKYTFAKFAIGIVVFLIIFALSYGTLRISTRYKAPKGTDGQTIEIENPKKIRNLLIILPSTLLGLFSGFVSASTLWQEILLFINQAPAGVTDSVFHLDLSFYFFSLSLLETVLKLAMLFFNCHRSFQYHRHHVYAGL